MTRPGQQELQIIEHARWRAYAERQRTAQQVVVASMGYEAVANELDAIFGPAGHGVSASLLRNALNDLNRNYDRGEWIPWFAAKSDTIVQVIDEASGRVSELTPEEELELLRETVRTELGAAGARVVAKVRQARRTR
jgi:hypothetical protein